MDAHALKNDFTVLRNQTLTYLDTAASSLKPDVVLDAMNAYYHNNPVNVHRGVYEMSHVATKHYEQARRDIANFINADFEEVIFTRGASSALNLVALTWGEQNLQAGDEIVTSMLEHHSHLLPWQQLAKRKKASLVYVPLNAEGRITETAVKKVITKRTKILTLTYVSNTLGYKTPLEPIINIAKAHGIKTSIDAAQAVPHTPVDVKKLDCDFLAFSGHKMCGPSGIGVLYAKRELFDQLDPLEYGGDMNDRVDLYDVEVKRPPYKFETGTPPIAEAIGLGRAVQYLSKIGLEKIATHEHHLATLAIEGLQSIEGVTVYNPTTDTGIVNFNFDGVHPHDAVTVFDEANVALRAGHHCAQLVLKFLEVAATLRASFYLYNTEEDVQHFIKTVTSARRFFTEVGF